VEASGQGLQLPDPNEHIPYRIVSQIQREELVPPNQFKTVWEISYEGPSGTIASVSIPEREYTPARVDEVVEQALHAVESVHALGPAPHPENLL
jgi:hypothetical protein